MISRRQFKTYIMDFLLTPLTNTFVQLVPRVGGIVLVRMN
jgi:hypothetical protein